VTDVQVEDREWLILDPDGRCYWREGRQGYSDIIGAGLYSTREADAIVAMGRGDKKLHVSSEEVQAALRHAQEGIERFAKACSAPLCDPKTCKHDDFEARVDVHCLQDTATWVAEVGVRCARCHLEFSFIGLPLAISTSKACLNIDGTIVTLPIEPGPKPIPAFGIIPVDIPPGRKES
jgi:hypothetical protein